MKKTRTQKGITLIALIITIIVLLILAIVTIGAIKNDGLIQYAQNARKDYTDAANKEQEDLNTLLGKIEGNAPGNNGEGTGGEGSGGENLEGSTDTLVPEEIQDTMLDKTENTTTYDIYGNKIVVPAGFKILVDETTGYTAEDISVTKGVVIQDRNGNEFVWVPVGKIYTDTAKTEEKAKTITLGRYESFVKNENGEYVPVQKAEDYATKVDIWDSWRDYVSREETADNHNYKNAIAKDIGAFCTNTIKKSGYYIGRYEAGDLETTKANGTRKSSTSDVNTVVCKLNQTPYNFVTQAQASSLSQNMYKDALNFTSDLINSYAWDTAIIFIQTFGGCEDYYTKNFSTGLKNTGKNNDKYCNIYDMSGNACEWSTETYSYASFQCVARGGYYYVDDGSGAVDYTRGRAYSSTTYSYYCNSFRPLLYL